MGLDVNLSSVVRTDIRGYATLNHHIGQLLNDGEAVLSSRNIDRQTLPRVFIDQREHPHRSPVMRAETKS